MRKWLTIVGAVLLLAWAPFLYSELTSEPAEKKARAGADDLEDDEHPPDPEALVEDEDPVHEPLEGEEAEVGEEVAEGEEGVEGEEVAVAEEVVAEEEEPDPAEVVPEERQEEDDEPAPGSAPMAQGPTGVLKSAFEGEPRDSFWAPDAEAKIAAIFSQVDAPEGTLQAAECRRRVCRVELAWSQENATLYTEVYGAIRDEFGLEVGVEPMLGIPSEEEAQLQKVVLYLPREGYSVADLKE